MEMEKYMFDKHVYWAIKRQVRPREDSEQMDLARFFLSPTPSLYYTIAIYVIVLS